jgi:cephalosporin hydroxylase
MTLNWHYLPHPWLVIEDSDHSFAGLTKSLEFFHHYLHVGDYIVVEDGFISLIGEDRRQKGGPARAITHFLRQHDEYQIDDSYCDFFGYNATANPNGYIRRIK